MHGLYVYEHNTDQHALITIVNEKKAKYKKHEVQDAERAKELLH
jgi:hypothetical protein